MNKIVKFGGSSLADATQFKKVAILSKVINLVVSWYHPHREKDLKMISK